MTEIFTNKNLTILRYHRQDRVLFLLLFKKFLGTWNNTSALEDYMKGTKGTILQNVPEMMKNHLGHIKIPTDYMPIRSKLHYDTNRLLYKDYITCTL